MAQLFLTPNQVGILLKNLPDKKLNFKDKIIDSEELEIFSIRVKLKKLQEKIHSS